MPAKKPKSKASKYGRKGLTPKQARLVTQLPAVIAGKKTKKQAMLDAGYSESTAQQQNVAIGSLRTNAKMQEALRAAGFTEELIAKKVMQGITATRTTTVRVGNRTKQQKTADFDAQHKFLVTGSELLDAFPAKKNLNAEVSPEQLLDEEQKGTVYAPWGDAAEDKA